MPPAKRKASTKVSSAAPPKPRLTKLAKQNGISNEQERQIADAFALFALSGVDGYAKEKIHGVIESENAVRVLTALGIPTSKNNISETMETLDPDGEGYIIYEPFLAYAALRLNLMAEEQDEESRAEEVQMSYNLFTRNGSGPITMAHLRRVAKTIREDVDDNTLKDMIMEANGTGKDGWKNGVTLEQFEAVLQRAGVYSAP